VAIAVALGLGAGEPEVVGEGQQALLGAVVQVAFQPAAFAVAGLDDADAGGSQVFELRQDLGLQPFVLQCQPDGGAELGLEVGQRCGAGGPPTLRPARGLRQAASERLRILDQPVELPGDGGVPLGHDMLVAHGRHGGRAAQPVHHLAQRPAGGGGQGAGGVAQVMHAQALDGSPSSTTLPPSTPT
jgi:hypothetical protein